MSRQQDKTNKQDKNRADVEFSEQNETSKQLSEKQKSAQTNENKREQQ